MLNLQRLILHFWKIQKGQHWYKKYKEFQGGIFWGEGVGWFWGKTRTTVLCGLAPPSIKASITPSHNLNWHSTLPELPITSAANIESDHVFLFFRQQRWKIISAHLQSYSYILTTGPSVHDIATKSTLEKKVMILFSKVKISKNIEQNGEAHQRPQYDPRQTWLSAAKGEQQRQEPHPHHRHHCRHRCHQYLCFPVCNPWLIWVIRQNNKNQENALRRVTDWWCFPQAVTAEDKGGRLDKLDKLDSPFVPIFNLPPNCAVLRWLWALRFFLICFWKHIAPVYVVGAHSALP